MKIEGIESKVMPTSMSGSTAKPTVATETRPVEAVETKQKPFAEQEDLYQIRDVSPEKIKNAVDDINKKIAQAHRYCQFSYHDETNRISITVKDENGEVIREIPPEKALDMIAKAWELAGLMVDEKR